MKLISDLGFLVVLVAHLIWSPQARADLKGERTLLRHSQQLGFGQIQTALNATRFGVCELRLVQLIPNHGSVQSSKTMEHPSVQFEVLNPSGQILASLLSQNHWALPAKALRQIRTSAAQSYWSERIISEEAPLMILNHDSSGQTRYLALQSDTGDRIELDRSRPESLQEAGVQECVEAH